MLSVAVVTTMMFTVTACGSKDDGKGAEPATVENTVGDAEPASEAKDEPASEAKDEPAENADAASGMSASDWVNSDEASTYTSVFNTMFDGAMTATFEADGNTLSMVFTLSEERKEDSDACRSTECLRQSDYFSYGLYRAGDGDGRKAGEKPETDSERAGRTSKRPCDVGQSGGYVPCRKRI